MNTYSLKFSEKRLVNTKFGERLVCNAEPTEEFWEAWREDKDSVKQAGYSLSKDPKTSEWKVALWEKPEGAEQQEADKEASRATDADIAIELAPGQTLRPFQRAGVAYALGRRSTLIADEMGLGKTVQAIATANATKPEHVLVICPASLLINWRNEIERFQTLDLPIHVISAGCAWPKLPRGWFLINYDILERYPQIKLRNWDLLVCDECHKLKNGQAKRTSFVLGGSRQVKAKNGQGLDVKHYDKIDPIECSRRLMLTGTPILNRPEELWTIIHAIDPTRWSSKFSFLKRYCGGVQTRFGFQTSRPSDAALAELQDRLRSTIMVRRLKKDVLAELPAKVRQIVTLQVDGSEDIVRNELDGFSKVERKIADAEAQVEQARSGGDDAAYKTAVAKLNAVRGVAFSEIAALRHQVSLAKLPAVIEHLEDVSGKVVVFAHHRDVIEGLCNALEKEGVVSITGSTDPLKRQAVVEKFQSDPSVRFFVGNIQAAGVGLTMTASSHVVFAELDWVPANLSQAEDRCHRIGQLDSVLVQHLVLDGSLDARMAKQLIAKQEVIDKALDNRQVPITKQADPQQPVQKANGQATNGKQNPFVAAQYTKDQVAAIQRALRIVAGLDEDHAQFENGIGFSKMDGNFGHSLANASWLSPKQAAYGAKLAHKYRRQYPEDLYNVIFPG